MTLHHNAFPLNDYQAKDFSRLANDVAGRERIGLIAPTTDNGRKIVTNGLIHSAQMIDIFCDIHEASSVLLYRQDGLALQSLNIRSDGRQDVMFHEAVPNLEFVHGDDACWVTNMDRENIHDEYAFNSFVNIIAAHALRRKPRAERLHMEDILSQS